VLRPEPFRCEVHEGDVSARVALHGELDLATAGEVEEALRRAAAAKRQVVLDLRGLSFIDSTGLNLVIRIDALARADGFSFSVVRAAPVVQRLFAMVGAEQHIAFVDSPAPGDPAR
jgi:anti-sigma B factor antagonist